MVLPITYFLHPHVYLFQRTFLMTLSLFKENNLGIKKYIYMPWLVLLGNRPTSILFVMGYKIVFANIRVSFFENGNSF